MTHDRFGGGLLGRFAPSVSKSPLKKADHATIWATNKHIMGPGVVGDMALVCGPQAEAAIWCSCGGCGAFCELESCGAATVRLLQQCAALRTRFVPSYNTCTVPPFYTAFCTFCTYFNDLLLANLTVLSNLNANRRLVPGFVIYFFAPPAAEHNQHNNSYNTTSSMPGIV